MSERKINLEEILDSIIDNTFSNVPIEHKTDFSKKLKDSEPYKTCIIAMQEACKQTLELAAENANLQCTNDVHPKGYPWFMHNPNGIVDQGDLMIVVNKQSILDLFNNISFGSKQLDDEELKTLNRTYKKMISDKPTKLYR